MISILDSVSSRRAGHFSAIAVVAALLVAVVSPSAANAYTPESPEVQALINKAVTYIEGHYNKEGAGYYTRLGGTCLTALAVYKHKHDMNHPLVQAAVAKCKQVAAQGVPWSSHSNYDVGIAVVFLCDLDAQLYRAEIDAMMRAMYKRQQGTGGWSYADHKTGDTSQTQYGALALWMTHRQGIEVPQDRVERLCLWLIRTQTPQGNWGYQGNDPGNFNRVAQSKETMALAAAGLGSTYVCAELLGFVEEPEDAKDPNRPPALQEAGTGERKGPITDRVPSQMLFRCLNDGDRFFARIPNKAAAARQYQHYYLYGLERYMAFREYARGIKEEEPQWYNQGVDYLARTQADNGSWKSCEAGPVIDTSFAVLFLLRSAQQSIKRIVEMTGRVRGAKGLPDDLSKIMLDDKGGIVDAKATPPIEILLAEMEKGDLDEIEGQLPDRLELDPDPQKRAAQLARLRRMAMNGAYQTRLTAVKTLGHNRNLDNVPVLIFALSDPDYRVVKSARDGLRFISRKFDGFGLRIADEAPTRQEWLKAQDEWKTWYLAVRPDGSLIE